MTDHTNETEHLHNFENFDADYWTLYCARSIPGMTEDRLENFKTKSVYSRMIALLLFASAVGDLAVATQTASWLMEYDIRYGDSTNEEERHDHADD